MARLSIIIPSHNRADLLEKCLTTVTACAPSDTEILVIDDASPDGEVSRVASTFLDVQVHRLAEQRGFCVAVNTGLRLAQAPVVELLNDDTQVSPGWAEPALAHFEDPSVGSVAPLVLQGEPGDEPIVDSAGDRYYLGGVARKRGHGEPLRDEYLRSQPVFGASGSSAFYRREAVLATGGFPEEFGAYFEDVDLAFRLHWAGWRTIYEPTSRVWHRVSASHGKTSRALLAQQSRNEELVFWRNVPNSAMLSALPRHLWVLLGKAWRRWREGRLLPFLRGRLSAWSDGVRLFQHRQRVHRLRASLSEWRVEHRWS